MRSAAEATGVIAGRSVDPLDHVDYRRADTPEQKDEIYRLRYRAYLREGAIVPSESERVTDRYDDLPNNFTFGIYIRGELYSAIRISVLTAEWRGLFSKFPDRFLLGSDTWINERWFGYDTIFKEYRGWLAQLPAEQARRIASGNALKLFAAQRD